MERRAASQTEEEEMNQRRRLLNLAKKGDPKAINRLFELYQVRVYSGEVWNKSVLSKGHSKSRKRTDKRRVLRKHKAKKSTRKAPTAGRASRLIEP